MIRPNVQLEHGYMAMGANRKGFLGMGMSFAEGKHRHFLVLNDGPISPGQGEVLKRAYDYLKSVPY